MAKNRAEWASGHRQLTRIGLSDGCGGELIPVAVQSGYHRNKFGGHLGNVGSNTVMYEFDKAVWKGTGKLGVKYTRYADDLAFSGSDFDTLRRTEELVWKTLEEIQRPRITVNSDKTVYVSRKPKRFVKGVVLTNDGKISIGRSKKRELRATVNRFISDGLPAVQALKLHGYLAFVNDIVPEFLVRLKKKYGEGFLVKLKEIHRQRQA